MFSDLFEIWMVTGDKPPYRKRHNYTERARLVGMLPEDLRTTEQWKRIYELREQFRRQREA